MRRSHPTEPSPGRARGFTLIETVMVIAITGVVMTLVAVFIVPATTAYFSAAARAQMGDEADTALRRIGRDLAGALPNSARITGQSLELIPVSGAARYAVDAGDTLQFGVADSSFAVVGPPLRLSSGNQRLAWYNLGPGVPDADAYTQSNVRVSSSSAGNATSVALSGAALPNSLQAPPYRVYAIEQPVTYRCDLTARTLTRYTGYGFMATQPDPPSGGSAAVLARRVEDCSFNYDQSNITARYALVTLRLQLKDRSLNEAVTLYHAIHIDNLP